MKHKKSLKKSKIFGKDIHLADELHRDEHIIKERKEPTHKAEYYYYMACWLYRSLKEDLDFLLLENKKLKKKITTNNVELRTLTNKLREIFDNNSQHSDVKGIAHHNEEGEISRNGEGEVAQNPSEPSADTLEEKGE